jgi:hypothetical protein
MTTARREPPDRPHTTTHPVLSAPTCWLFALPVSPDPPGHGLPCPARRPWTRPATHLQTLAEHDELREPALRLYPDAEVSERREGELPRCERGRQLDDVRPRR